MTSPLGNVNGQPLVIRDYRRHKGAFREIPGVRATRRMRQPVIALALTALFAGKGDK
jgi:hypothetical protein